MTPLTAQKKEKREKSGKKEKKLRKLRKPRKKKSQQSRKIKIKVWVSPRPAKNPLSVKPVNQCQRKRRVDNNTIKRNSRRKRKD